MAWNGSGTFSRIYNWVTDRDAGVKIQATRMDGEDDGFATGINACLAKNGENAATANLNLGGFRYTNAATPTALTDLSTALYAKSAGASTSLVTSAGTANAQTVTNPLAYNALTAGIVQWFLPGNENTGATNINVDALGNMAVRYLGHPLTGGELQPDIPALVISDGTNWNLVNPCTGTTGSYNVKAFGAMGDGTTDDSAAINAAITIAGSRGGGTIIFPVGRYKCNLTITEPNINFVGSIFARDSSLNTQLVPNNTANPILSVGDGTTLCVGFQMQGIALDGLGTGTVGMLINGADRCIYRNFSAQGCTDASVRITSSATQSTTYQFMDGFDIAARNSAAALGLDVVYGSTFTTAIYLCNGTLSSQSGSGHALQITRSTINAANIWVNVGGTGTGISLVTAGGTTGTLICSNVNVDSSSSSDVLVNTDANVLPSQYIMGSVHIDGIWAMPGGNTTRFPGYNQMYPQGVYQTPQVVGNLNFNYSANAWNQGDQIGDNKVVIYRSSGGNLNLDTSGGSGNISLITNAGVISPTGTLSMGDGNNISGGTTTGFKIGTGTSQKIGFWNATPIARPTASGVTSGFTGGVGATVQVDATFTGNTGATAYTIGDIVSALKRAGLITS